jgi:hypothetical protein
MAIRWWTILYIITTFVLVLLWAGSCVNIHIIVLAVNITFLFLITCLLVGECTYHKFDNTQAHWGMNFVCVVFDENLIFLQSIPLWRQ